MSQIEILRVVKESSSDNKMWDNVLIKCIECKNNFVVTDRYNVENHDLKMWYTDFCCRVCKSRFEDIDQFNMNEKQEIDERLQILESEYRENIRAQEPNKNQYCKVKKVKSTDYEYINGQYTTMQSKEKSYVFKCGAKFPYEYWTLELVTKEHVEKRNCNICKYLAGETKKKTGFTQYQVNELFRHGITNKSSSSKNFVSEDNAIYHYSTIEKIRTQYNVLIDNSQCWSAGFASCEMHLGICELPLTSLSELDFNIYSIKVLDTKEAILFTIVSNNDKLHHTMLFGHDDGQNFLVELYTTDQLNPNMHKAIKTVKEAYQSMLPIEAINNKNVIRQGDLFFIPVNGKLPSDAFYYYQKAKFEPIEVRLDRYTSYNEDMKIYQEYKKLNIKHGYGRYYDDSFKDATTKLLAQKIKRDFINKKDPHKRLERLQIFDTNHESTEMITHKGLTYVKGQIIHTNRQHQKLKLNDWHLVVKNRVKQSYNIQRQTMRGD